MRILAALLTGFLLLVAPDIASACSCATPEPDTDAWLKRAISEATFVVYVEATGFEQTSPPSTTEYHTVKVLRHLKGRSPFKKLVSGQCASGPKQGQKAVLFLDASGNIMPCTGRNFSSDEEFINAVLRVQARNAN